MRFNPKARSDAGQTDDRTGQSGGGIGGGGMQLPIPGGGGGGMGSGGKIGIGSVIVTVLFLVISMCSSGGPFSSSNLQSPGQGSDQGSDQGTGQGSGEGVSCTGDEANQGDVKCQISLITESVQDYWKSEYPKETNKQYEPIRTVVFSGQTQSACGTAASAMGPFYCPNDKLVYIDQFFMKDMLEGQLGAKGGPFSLGYVLAHEYGHHIEDQLGILGQMRTQQGPKSDSVRVELMADCLGGMWAAGSQGTKDTGGNAIIEGLTTEDVANAIDAAQSVGDDRIQKESSGRVNPEQWTHGSSAQRQKWFEVGYTKRSIKACNTFDTDDL